MRFSLVACACLFGGACGGGDGGTDPGTSHDLVGDWSYDMPLLQDGHGLACSITGPVLSLTQTGVTFSGNVHGGMERCTWPGGADSGLMQSAPVLAGAIRGDSVTFNVLNSLWHNVGTFITEDSMQGVVNSIYSIGGQQYQIVGYWYSKRLP